VSAPLQRETMFLPGHSRHRIRSIVVLALLCIGAAIMMLPIFWAISSSLK